MSKKVDVAVIGSGPAGSIAGAYLARGGLKTTVFEAANVIGGPRYGSYTETGYHSDICCHIPVWFMTANGGGGWWPQAAVETDATINWQCLPNTAIYLRGEVSIMPYCSNGTAFVGFLRGFSPMPLAESTERELAKIFDQIIAIPEEEIWSAEMDTMPFREWLDSVTDDEVAKQILGVVVGLYLLCPVEKALDVSSMTLIGGCFVGSIAGRSNLTGIVGGASDAIPKAFCDVTAKHGGQALTNHRVTKVIVEGGKARGVVVSNDKGEKATYEAKYVVAASMYPSYPLLLGENLPKAIADIIETFEEVYNISVDVHFGLKRQVVKPFWSQVMVLTDDVQYRGAILVPSHFEPTLAPEGKQLLQAELFVAREEYKKRPKEEWVRQLTDMVEDVFPGVKAEIEMIRSHVVSPSVHYQYGPYPKIPLECPGISNLYFCGDCTQAPGQGTERAASSAMIVAKTILQKEGKSAR